MPLLLIFRISSAQDTIKKVIPLHDIKRSHATGRISGVALKDALSFYKTPNYKNSYLSRLTLKGRDAEYSLIYLTGLDNNNILNLTFDTNHNNSFLDDTTYRYPIIQVSNKDSLKQKIAVLPEITIPVWYRGTKKNINLFVVPKFLIPDLKINSGNDFADSTRFFFESRIISKGTFYLKSIRYNIELINNSVALSLTPDATLRIYRGNQNENLKDGIEYNISDTLNVGEYKAFIDSTLQGDKAIFITFIRNTNGKGISKGYYAPDINTGDISGNPFRLYNIHKPFVLLDFWGTWCIPCIEGIPSLKSLFYNNIDSLSIVSIALDENEALVKKFIDSAQIKWTQLFNPFSMPFIISEFKISHYPTFILLDRMKKIIYRGYGMDDLNKVMHLVSHNAN